MTLGSLFDGSGGFPLGAILCGITPVWAAEVEPYPIKVTKTRLPFMKHLGNVTEIDGAKIEPVDIITFGSPCQDLSIAGKRAGLQGNRSGLFHEAMRIVKEMRNATNGEKPRYIVWENVTGAFSSNKGEDFRVVLETIMQTKDETFTVPRPEKWNGSGCIVADSLSIAWRTLDAQFWGVPQRRKRIYLVADFDGERAGKILFESEGLSGYSKTSISSWQGAASAARESTPATGIVLNDQGGNRMDVTDDVTCTLRAEAHHPPCVMESAAFCTEPSAKSRGIGYEAEKSPTLRAGVVPATVYENHRQDCRYTGPLDVSPTVLSAYGTGGNNQPFVVETPKTLKIRSGCEGGGKGPLIQENKSATLGTNNDQTLFQPVAYGICSKDSNSMKSDNPNSGFYEADTSRTLDGNGGNPSCNQGGIAVIEGNGTRPSHKGDGYRESDVMYTLNATEQHAVAFADVHATLSASDGPKGPSSQMMGNPHENFVAEEEMANTLVATDYKDQPIVNEPRYIVRRLTPTECARLQGFPDWWCDELGTENPTDEEMDFWRDVFETHRKIVTGAKKPKTDRQIIKWLKNPHSDSAEYKMWGNGVALPNVVFVLSGIAALNYLEELE